MLAQQQDTSCCPIEQRIKNDHEQYVLLKQLPVNNNDTDNKTIRSELLYFMTLGVTSTELLLQLVSRAMNMQDYSIIEQEFVQLQNQQHPIYVKWNTASQLLAFYECQLKQQQLPQHQQPLLTQQTSNEQQQQQDDKNKEEQATTSLLTTPVVVQESPTATTTTSKPKTLEVPERLRSKFNLKDLEGSFENIVGKELCFSRQNMGYKALCVGKCNDMVLNQFVLHLDDENRLKELCETTDFNRLPRNVRGIVTKVVELPAAYRFKFKKSTSMIGCYVQFEYN